MGLRGEKVTEEWGLWLVAIYTELVFEAVPGRWRIAFGVYTTRLAALKFAKVSLQEEGPILRGRAEKPQTEEDTQELQEELAENQRLLKAAGAMVKREQNKKKRG